MSGCPAFQEILNEAVAKHGSGRLDEAASLYEQVLAYDGDNATALHMLGLLLCREEEVQRAGRLVQERRYGLADGVSLGPLSAPDLSVHV